MLCAGAGQTLGPRPAMCSVPAVEHPCPAPREGRQQVRRSEHGLVPGRLRTCWARLPQSRVTDTVLLPSAFVSLSLTISPLSFSLDDVLTASEPY